MGMTFIWAVELGRYGITVNAMAPSGYTRMTEGLYRGAEPPPDQDPALNAPLVAFLASEEAAYVNGQMLGRTGFGYTIFQTPRQVAIMSRTADGHPRRSPPSSTRCSASTSSPSACPRIRCSARRTDPGRRRDHHPSPYRSRWAWSDTGSRRGGRGPAGQPRRDHGKGADLRRTAELAAPAAAQRGRGTPSAAW